MLMISHDLQTIQRISDRILFLDRGRVVGLGDPEDVVNQYDAHARENAAAPAGREWGTGEVTFTRVELLNQDGAAQTAFAFGEAMQVRMAYRADCAVDRPVFGFALSGANGEVLYGNNTQLEGVDVERIEGEGRLTLTVERITLGPGAYTLSVAVHAADHRVNYHRLDRSFPFTVTGEKSFEGGYMPVRWSIGP